MKHFAYVASWGKMFPENTLGLHALEYEDGQFRMIESYMTDISMGCVGILNDSVFFEDDGREYPGAPNGGGRLFSYKIEKDGKLRENSWMPSMGVCPSAIDFSIDGKYAVLINHSSKRNPAICTEFADGEYRIVTKRNEPNVVLFRLRGDGSLDKVTDIVNLIYIENTIREGSIPHFVKRHPYRDIFYVAENGEDRVYGFKLDREKEKLILIKKSFESEKKSLPRYLDFSKDGKAIFLVDENRPFVNVLSIDDEDGLSRKQLLRMVPEDQPVLQDKIFAPAAVSPTDIKVSPDGKYLYTACRGTDTISVFDIDSRNNISLKQIINCGAHNPRGISFDPEGKFLISCGLDESCLVSFEVKADGCLEKKYEFRVPHPGCIAFY